MISLSHNPGFESANTSAVKKDLVERCDDVHSTIQSKVVGCQLQGWNVVDSVCATVSVSEGLVVVQRRRSTMLVSIRVLISSKPEMNTAWE